MKLKNLAPGVYRLAVQRLGYQRHDPSLRHLELGQPGYTSRETVADSKKNSAGAPTREFTVTVTSSGEFVTSLRVRENNLYFARSLGNERGLIETR